LNSRCTNYYKITILIAVKNLFFFLKNWNFSSKIESSVKYRNFQSNIKSSVKNRNFWSKVYFFIFSQHRNFGSKIKITVKNRNFRSTIYFFFEKSKFSVNNLWFFEKSKFLVKNFWTCTWNFLTNYNFKNRSNWIPVVQIITKLPF